MGKTRSYTFWKSHCYKKKLALSKIVHFLILLPSPSAAIVNQLNKLFFDFLWNGKPDPIKRSVIKLKPVDGGLGMIDLSLFDKALKLTWLRRYFTSTAAWKLLIDNKYPLLKNINNFGNKYEEQLVDQIKNPFWANVVEYFYSFYNKYSLRTKQEVEATRFLYNSDIKIGRQVIKNKKLISNEVFSIDQLKANDTFLTFQELNNKLNTPLNFLEYNSIINSVKSYLNKYSSLKSFKEVPYSPALNIIMLKEKGSSVIYKNMLNTDKEITGFKRWSNTTNISRKEWEISFKLLKSTTSDTKLKWLQFRILHYTLTTNRSVSKFKTNQSSYCTFCGAHSETILHLFWDCTCVQRFWNGIAAILNRKCNHSHNFKLTKHLVIFGKCEIIRTDNICDLIILLSKYYIYRCKVQSQTLNINLFIRDLYRRYNIEKIVNKNSITFKNNWAPYLPLFKGIIQQ